MALEKREINISYDAPLNRHWFNNNPFETHFLNTYTILIPDGEKFIIRSSRKYLDKLSDELREETKGLFYQEGQHSIQHAKVLTLLENEGYKIRAFIAVNNYIDFKICERIAPKILSLSTCSGIEHLNSCIAEFFLKDEPPFHGASTEMAQIFSWHFAEEIEHGCVVYNILKQVNDNYWIRIFGLLAAYLVFIPVLYFGSMFLAFQDRSLFRWAFWQGLLRFSLGRGFLKTSLISILQYLKPSFHPINILKMHLVKKGIDHYQMLTDIEIEPAKNKAVAGG